MGAEMDGPLVPLPAAHPTARLQLDCKPGREGDRLTFAYRVRNPGPATLYVMEAMPDVDPASGAARANREAAVVMRASEGDVIIGHVAAPSPPDRRTAAQVFPLARLLPANAGMEGRLEVPLPLAEASPYYSDLPLRSYAVVEIGAVIFMIGYWVDDADELVALPVDYAPGLYAVTTRRGGQASMQVVSQRFPAKGLQLFQRSDGFPRYEVR
jgi:hypothetical protein